MTFAANANYAVRLLLYYGFARHLPSSVAPGKILWRRLRSWICRPLFADCGDNINIERGAYIARGRTISIGSNSSIGINAAVGAYTRIGSNVMMGPEVLVFTRNHSTDRVDTPMIMQGYEETAPVTIGDDVWIGARVIILPGVSIGSSTVLGAGAVVAKDVPAGSVVVGNPGRVVRNRYSPISRAARRRVAGIELPKAQ